jgi:D-sedoheptulose 7-phosphate isomerase
VTIDPAEFVDAYLAECQAILSQLDRSAIQRVVDLLASTRDAGGRVFVLGVGGSAATASHFVNDLRKITLIEAYAPTDNVAELTARTNDEGWASVFAAWLAGSRLRPGDLVFVYSVGGGDRTRNVTPCVVEALQYARQVGARVAAVVGRDGGATARAADACVLVPVVNADRVTPHTEAFHSVIGHLIVSHPALKRSETRWESIEPGRRQP